MNFKEFRKELSESVSQGKPFKIGKYKAVINRDGSKFVAYLDGEKFDSFRSMRDAQKALKDFVDLVGKQ